MNEAKTKSATVSQFLYEHFEQGRRILLSPKEAFREQKTQSGYWKPTAFAMLCIAAPRGAYALLWAPFTLGFSILWLIPSVIYGTIFLYMLSTALYGLVRCYREIITFDSIFRCVAYSWVSYFLLLIPIPLLNHLFIAAAFGFYLHYALREVHGFDKKQAILIAIVPSAIVLVIGAIMSLASMFMLGVTIFKAGTYFFAS
ncbi:MAG: YIP1 family protein [Candidatus Hinthialibacter antarcticus]|nr:YIP1 family protein [Candidatus Hinthialibacter antarcticus]